MSSTDSTPLKPCEVPCPQCGSPDISRCYRAKGKTWSVDDVDTMNRYATAHMWTRTATDDHLTHHCRCCQHDWQTFTLRGETLAKITSCL